MDHTQTPHPQVEAKGVQAAEAGPERDDDNIVGAGARETAGHGEELTTPPSSCSEQTLRQLCHQRHRERTTERKKAERYTCTGSMVPPGRGNEKYHTSLRRLVHQHPAGRRDGRSYE